MVLWGRLASYSVLPGEDGFRVGPWNGQGFQTPRYARGDREGGCLVRPSVGLSMGLRTNGRGVDRPCGEEIEAAWGRREGDAPAGGIPEPGRLIG